ncbi:MULTISPECIES: c-type cytochrome [unclassified Methylibium]|jgi:mono/diheme cytochrome c family protein|uniref:c-type cytochrome n=1 Tax=unclassified Methylibium TaxID=2633235 RepID=UPI0006F99367|nr:c-type cytochrome [Methylibium sp. Root1272]KQW66104.1 cytochrome C biogenesis protein CcdA [Methylibium sp. Root1272]
MRSPEFSWCGLAVACLMAGCAAPAAAPNAAAPSPHGHAISEQEMQAWNIDVRGTDGAGLPPGSGSVAAGKTVFDAKCAACHGAAAAGGPVFGPMVGGIGSFKTDRRVLTPGSMYPYAPILFDYVRRAMPMNAPQSLSNDETYAVSGYLLHLNGLVPADAVMTAQTLAAVRMPNRDGFIVDDRPDTKATRCMSNCSPISSAAR